MGELGVVAQVLQTSAAAGALMGGLMDHTAVDELDAESLEQRTEDPIEMGLIQ